MPPIHPDHPPYIPIIKWQNAETKVLEAIEDDPGLVDRVWPCIEVRGVTHHDLLMSEVYHSWKGTVLVDYSDPTDLPPDFSTTSNLVESVFRAGDGSEK
ncbi:hypothetical protein, partial [Pseudomonas aeruginosa]|uniref:hypothetical protein n=2 Tax=Pseudomonas aeruginosa TaxID=287 RepID=UPI002E8E6F7F|nr:hypothetical protein [Pseudomonas aeruginosa]